MITNIILFSLATQQLSLNISSDPGAAIPVLKNTSFVGLTGAYSFDALQNRLMSLNLLQIQNASLVVIGKTDLNQLVSMSNPPTIQWPAGSRPSDRDPVQVVSIGDSVLIASIVMSVLGCIFVGLAAISMRSQSAERMVQAASPRFLLLILMGCALAFISLPYECVCSV